MSNIVYDAMLRYAPHKRKRNASGWYSFNAVCCPYNGQSRPDTRERGGILLTGDNVGIYHCHNCKFKAGWSPGGQMTKRMTSLLEWMGMPNEEFKKLNFKVWQLKEQQAAGSAPVREYTRLEFAGANLPAGAQPFSHWLQQDPVDPKFMEVAQYISDRGEAILTGYEYYWTPRGEFPLSMHKRAIIPFHWEGKTVGYTARAIFPTRDRYWGDAPLGYLFNTESITPARKYIIVTEGSLDAIAVEGVATLGDKANPDQIQWLNQTGKEIIVLPDREKMGGTLVDIAVAQGWCVSFPRWDKGVKDAADAVKRYGKLYTLWSVIDTKTNNRLEINVKRKMALK